MSENTFHAAALAMFVALCIVASSDGARDNATKVAASRAALIAAQQADPPRAATRVAQLQATVEPVQRAAR